MATTNKVKPLIEDEEDVGATVDIAADAGKVNDKASLEIIVALAKSAYIYERDITQLEDQLKVKRAEYFKLMMDMLPERMTAAGLQSFELGNGFVVNISEFVSASIPTEKKIEETEGPEKEVLIGRRKRAFEWLESQNATSLIKNKLSAEFGKGEDKFAKRFFKMIQAAGFPSSCEESVNHNTLLAFIKEKRKQGVSIPEEPFALFVGSKAELKQKKKKA